jgi:hypothetical protein
MSLLYNLTNQNALCSIFQITYVHNSLNQHFNKGVKNKPKQYHTVRTVPNYWLTIRRNKDKIDYSSICTWLLTYLAWYRNTDIENIGYTRHRTKTKKTILTLAETKKMRHTDPIKNESELRCSGRTAVPASYKPFYGTKLLLL